MDLSKVVVNTKATDVLFLLAFIDISWVILSIAGMGVGLPSDISIISVTIAGQFALTVVGGVAVAGIGNKFGINMTGAAFGTAYIVIWNALTTPFYASISSVIGSVGVWAPIQAAGGAIGIIFAFIAAVQIGTQMPWGSMK